MEGSFLPSFGITIYFFGGILVMQPLIKFLKIVSI